MSTRQPPVALLALFLLLAVGCRSGGAGAPGPGADPRTPGAASVAAAPRTPAPGGPGETAAAQFLPGVGPRLGDKVPPRARQAVVVTGEGRNSSRSTAVLYERTPAGWRAGPGWPARNALDGWTDRHHAGDLRSPIGVYTLTDAGGLLPDPGTRLPYERSDAFTAPGTGFEGEPLDGSFDYVIAIDYNRQPGTSPLDPARPLGADRGGGIWLHVDHGGPTQGCVSLAEEHMRELLLSLDPGRHPVVVMGDAASLAR
ncbi:lipoprotein [Streptomyces fumigatiscleroticus]|nr:lipoprotein [Streptomyces fumigatiscleroticus]